jgi:hypothetical protein
MGDKYKPVPYPNECPLSPYPNGLEPDSLDVTFSGLEKADAAPPGTIDPPNGTFTADWVSCGLWSGVAGDCNFIVTLSATEQMVQCETFDAIECFYGTAAAENTAAIANTRSNVFFYKTTGTAFVDWGFDGGVYPDSWDGAALLNIPTSEGYFAEELPTELADRKNRYAAHHDGTNIKIYINQ